jgi:hypothetical protein
MQKNAFIQQICDLSKNDKDLTNEFWENLFKFTIMGYIMIYIYGYMGYGDKTNLI